MKYIFGLFGCWLLGFIIFLYQVAVPKVPEEGVTDAIVVLTGGPNRLSEGLELLQQGKAAKIFISGVHAAVTKSDLLRSHGVAARWEPVIFLGKHAANTVENAQETADWVQQEKVHSLRLITSHYHMPRSLVEFQRALPTLKIIPHGVLFYTGDVPEWSHDVKAIGLLFREYNKYLVSWLGLGLVRIGKRPALKNAH